MKTKSAKTGRYTTAKAAKARPATHYKSDDYPARMLRKLVRIWEGKNVVSGEELTALIANIKRRMKWK